MIPHDHESIEECLARCAGAVLVQGQTEVDRVQIEADVWRMTEAWTGLTRAELVALEATDREALLTLMAMGKDGTGEPDIAKLRGMTQTH